MHAPRRLDGVGGRVRGKVGESGKGASHRHLSGVGGCLGERRGDGRGGLGRTGGQFLPSLSFPIRSLFLHPPLSIVPFAHSVPYLFLNFFVLLHPGIPTFSHLCPHLCLPFPVSIPVFPPGYTCPSVPFRQDAPMCLHTCAHMHTDTPIYTLVDPHMYAWMGIPAHTLVHTCVHDCLRLGAHMDAFPHTIACIRPCPPWCTHKCTYGRTPGCIHRHGSRCIPKHMHRCTSGCLPGYLPWCAPGCTYRCTH